MQLVLNPIQEGQTSDDLLMEYWLLPLNWLLYHRLGVNVLTGGVWIEKISILTNKTTRLETSIQAEQFHTRFAAYKQGEPIQVAMPFLNNEEREYTLSGMTTAEWNRLFE